MITILISAIIAACIVVLTAILFKKSARIGKTTRTIRDAKQISMDLDTPAVKTRARKTATRKTSARKTTTRKSPAKKTATKKTTTRKSSPKKK